MYRLLARFGAEFVAPLPTETIWTQLPAVAGTIKHIEGASYQHASQNPAAWFDMYLNLARIRGYESDTTMAEAYVRARNSSGLGGRAARTGKKLQ